MVAKQLAAILFVVTILFSAAASGQDFHVETTLYDLTRAQPRELMRSVTLFHASRTYDFIQEVGELIVFEPAHNRFLLLNTRQNRVAVAHIDEIKHMLQIARKGLSDHLDQLKNSDKPGTRDVMEQIAFQFDPSFDETLKQREQGPRLELKSKFFQYDVQCATPPTPQHGAVYLNYADWICRLNYVLAPGAILPDQRVKLDDALRKANLIPVEVNFAGGVGEPIRVRAMHRMYWALNDKDRELLHQWDTHLARRDLKKMSFKEYQQSLLMSQASRKR